MKTQLKLFADNIYSKTGISLSVYSENNTLLVGDDLGVQINKTDSIVFDEKSNCTLFPFSLYNNKFIGCIKGSTEAQKNYAFFITELATTFDVKSGFCSKDEFYRAILNGEKGVKTTNFLKKNNLHNGSCFAMLISSEKSIVDICDVLINYGNIDTDIVLNIDEKTCVFIKFVDDTFNEYTSQTEFADFLCASVLEEVGIAVTIYVGGIVDSVLNIGTSYNQAVSVLKIAKMLGSKKSVHFFKEYAFVNILEELPKNKLIECLNIIMDEKAREVFNDEELVSTAEEILANNLNVSETSREMFLHRNTLTYRLDKLEKITGLNLRNFEDAVSFRFVTVLIKLIGDKKD